MSEQKSAKTGIALAKWLVWCGGITGIGLVALIFLYVFGDPRPRSVNESQIFGEAFAIPGVIPNGPYYRLRAEYFPMTNAVSKTNLLGKAWMVLFSDAVA